jgi:GDPmannose 4,6-dehydratase
MRKKKALITGISGQDGSYLAEYLIELGYDVFGLIRRLSTPENQSSRYDHILNKMQIFYGDLNDEISLYNLIDKVRPDEIYNLAAMSHVQISFNQPAFTIKNNSLSVLTLIEAMRKYCHNSRFYQASSSEMFGNSVDEDGFQRISTPMHPVSPYGCSKLLAYNLTRHYRNAYKLHICNGILFNHESPRRGSNFVTNKIIKTAVEIKKNKKNKLVLGNLDAQRDWGHSYDYVRAMHKILNHEKPMDFIVSTGITRSIRDFCKITFDKLGLNYLDYVITDKKYMRPEELNFLCGDSTEIRKILNWKPKYTFEKMIDEMIEFWLKVNKN